MALLDQISQHSGSFSAALQTFLGAILLAGVYWVLTAGQQPVGGIPIIHIDSNKKERSWRPWRSAASDFQMRLQEVVENGEKVPGGIFQVKAGAGYKVVLPNSFAHELRNNPDLAFDQAVENDFHTHLPGFDGMKESSRRDGLMADIVRIKLTQALGLLTTDLVDETDYATKLWLGHKDDWTNTVLKPGALDVITRVSSRIFGGKELARDEEWLEITKNYTIYTFQAAYRLHEWPKVLRPIANWFFENDAKTARQYVAEARRLVTPQVEKRLKARDEAIASGVSSKALPDVFSWALDVAKGRPINFAETQLALSMAAIHTSTELTMRVMTMLCNHPEVIEPLREEMTTVLKQDGWAKTSLYKMKLLDSFIKECQRFSQMAIASMHRYVTKPITLSNGTTLPTGSCILVLDNGTQNPEYYTSPEKFDAWQYLKMRQRSGEENQHQLVTTGPDNLGFGHGQHACPGRFFASNEIKIVLCYLLIQYDWRFEPGKSALPDIPFEHVLNANPETVVQYKSREAEIDVLNPTA
ncbi:hypothetical protein CBER1_11522 [Cercospora berteroae]|uniref:Cytochrome P450 monooxygenase n=1 Tax=Cercospora berteroae TaxID=357750 RepID=A0A2S6CGW4_9PEZI|nr:hypothetical protein CBER1_11522 [Cercospora berteroae]